LAGEMRSKDKQLEQLINDFATDYADAKDKYKETLAKVQVSYYSYPCFEGYAL
jgi:DNA repair protein RAD50